MRSSILFITVALFCFINLSTQQVAGGYQNLTNAQVYGSKDARGALNYGAKRITQIAVAANKIPNYVYSVSKLLSAQEQVVAGMNYKFHAYISDAKNRTLLDSNYTVYQNLNGTYSLSQWRYKILKGAKKPVKKTL